MDFLFFSVIFFVAIVILLKRPFQSKGERGEAFVAKILGNTVHGEQYVINDLLFKNEEGKSCQIDHVYINKFGIWVIETKNYSGRIYGMENQREWTQYLAGGREEHKFYNPVKQNQTHVYCLSQYLNVQGIFQNVVVFLPSADITTVSSSHLYTTEQLKMIKNKSTNILLSTGEMEDYYNKLLELKKNSTVTREEHVSNIHEMQSQIEQGICPRCQGTLVVRKGRNGDFYGCSNYPTCKFTKNID